MEIPEDDQNETIRDVREYFTDLCLPLAILLALANRYKCRSWKNAWKIDSCQEEEREKAAKDLKKIYERLQNDPELSSLRRGQEHRLENCAKEVSCST